MARTHHVPLYSLGIAAGLEIKAEYEAGQKLLSDLEAKQANLRQTLIRISGAVQVLEEELGGRRGENGDAGESTGQTPQSRDDVHGNVE